MIENAGESEIESADDANVPVDIWLHDPLQWVENDHQYNGDQDPTTLWCLSANNYMPRKGCLSDGRAYIVWGTEQELRQAIKDYILPLYETAVKILQGMIQGIPDCNLYYWDLPDSLKQSQPQ